MSINYKTDILLGAGLGAAIYGVSKYFKSKNLD